MYKPCIPTETEKQALEVARIGFMAACPFFAHYFYSEAKEVLTRDIPTAATDGRHIFINPTYLASLKPPETVFVLAHELDHMISKHVQRFKHYEGEKFIKSKPADAKQWNIATDYVINAGLIEQGVGMMNPSWLFHPGVTGDMLPEDVYEKHYKEQPKTFGGSGKCPKGMKGDKVADGQGGSFDELLPPPVNPVTGAEDLPTEAEFKEAIARAASAARNAGKFPDSLKRRVDAILEPVVNWREHIRMEITGKIGARHETWERPNRRRLVLNPMVIMPGKRGYGAELVVVAVDTSGSIGDKEIGVFFTELSSILADVRPKLVKIMWADAAVHRVDEASTMDELEDVRAKGAPGGGGTSFVPVFDKIAEDHIQPDTLIYFTDMEGRFPTVAPAYPVVWASIGDKENVGPFGTTVPVLT
jgi:predicted metal-dependent peptidase